MGEAGLLLDRWLGAAARRLQPKQREVILEGFAHAQLPLWLRLAFEGARKWRSSTEVGDLAPTVEGLFGELLQQLSTDRNHGAAIVSRALSYLACSRYGLAEEEILDLLGRDRDVLEDIQRRSPRSPDIDGLPPIVWSRLRFDLAPYLTERSATGATLLSFFHRQLADVASRLARLPGQMRYHGVLAEYFATQHSYYDDARKEQPNLRRAAELAYQLTKARNSDGLAKLLCDLDFLEAKVQAGMVFDLIEDFSPALAEMPPEHPHHPTLIVLHRGLGANVQFLARHPQCLFQCLWNFCW